MEYNLITILGPTAVGKTRLAALLAASFNGEIISADSRQVYKRMNLGTGKDYDDYIVNGLPIPYYLIDIVEPDEEFNLFLFREHFFNAYSIIKDNKHIPFMAGGTGLYLNSIISNYQMTKANAPKERISQLNEMKENELKDILLELNPMLHNKTDIEEKERIIKAILVAESKEESVNYQKINSLNIGVHYNREIIKKRITLRLKERLNKGMIEEVENLLAEGITIEKLKFFGLEYKFIGMYLHKELTYNDMFQKLNSAIHGFAKRQMTWYRKMEKEGVVINWIEGNDLEKAMNIIMRYYGG